ncbi:hypothetical protein DFH28DRAFT_879692, partial [Melampsora americana]
HSSQDLPGSLSHDSPRSLSQDLPQSLSQDSIVASVVARTKTPILGKGKGKVRGKPKGKGKGRGNHMETDEEKEPSEEAKDNTVVVFASYKAYLHELKTPKNIKKPKRSTSTPVKEYEWNCVEGPPGGQSADLLSTSSERVKQQVIKVIEDRIPQMIKYLFDHSPRWNLHWVGLDYSSKKVAKDYDIDTDYGWQKFVNATLSFKRDHSIGILVKMENPALIEQEKSQFQNQIEHLQSLQGQTTEDSSQKPKKELPPLESPNLHSGTVDCLMEQYGGGKSGSEHMKYVDPLDSTKWTDGRREGRKDVSVFIPPKTSLFKTFLNGHEPSGVQALHLAHPSFGPPQTVDQPEPALNPSTSSSLGDPATNIVPQETTSVISDKDHRMFLTRFCGTFDDFLLFSLISPEDTATRQLLSELNLDHWSTFITSEHITKTKLKDMKFSLGAAIKLISGANRFPDYIRGNIKAGRFRKIEI